LKVHEARFAAIDFESAGTAPGLTDEPVQIAIVHWNGGTLERVLDSYLKPSRPVTWAAREVHGLSDAMLRDAPSLIDLWPAIREALRDRWVVAHGGGTEKRFLNVFPFHGFGPWVDTLHLARAIHPMLESHALSDTIESLGLGFKLAAWPNFRWHDAASDAAASLVLLEHLIDAANLRDDPAEILTRPNLQTYFRSRRK
jgi:DNA polymerase-3 subunit epsilon